MTASDGVPDRAAQAFAAHEAFERQADGFAITTTHFDAAVTAEETADGVLRYTVTVRAPLLSTAAEEPVGPAVEDGWFETFERRLEDAPAASRRDVDLAEYDLSREAGDAVARYVFEWSDPEQAPAITKALAEFVEGTYVAGVVPGYEYGEPVAGLLSAASHDGGDGASGIPPL